MRSGDGANHKPRKDGGVSRHSLSLYKRLLRFFKGHSGILTKHFLHVVETSRDVLNSGIVGWVFAAPHRFLLLYSQFEQDFEKPSKLLDSASVQPFVYQVAPSFRGLWFAPSPERIRLHFARVSQPHHGRKRQMLFAALDAAEDVYPQVI